MITNQQHTMGAADGKPLKGFALLIKAPRAERRFVPLQGEIIVILDKEGKELWSLKLPVPMGNPGVILHEVQIDLLTEREFGRFCQKTWTPPACDQPDPPPNPKPPRG